MFHLPANLKTTLPNNPNQVQLVEHPVTVVQVAVPEAVEGIVEEERPKVAQELAEGVALVVVPGEVGLEDDN